MVILAHLYAQPDEPDLISQMDDLANWDNQTIINAVIRLHRPLRHHLESYRAQIASRLGKRIAAIKLLELHKTYLTIGDQHLPLSRKRLRELAKEQSNSAKAKYKSGGNTNNSFSSALCGQFRIQPPNWRKFGVMPSLNRLMCNEWWFKKLKKLHDRKFEGFLREIGRVNKHEGIYASNWAVDIHQESKSSNSRFFDDHFIVNEDGEFFELKDVVSKSVSDPRIRKCELMTRISGFEKIAENRGDVPLFVTLTAPGVFHRAYAQGGLNQKFNGSTPREAQAWLMQTWARCRAAYHREGIKPYGFRVVEPHHDGTPHWHLLLFMPKDDALVLTEILRKYWLAEYADEPGAKKHRIVFVDLDPTKGSAAGYMAKYISKNLDGSDIDYDQYGNDAPKAAERIVASCSVWGIRQFQQIGGPPVSVWRELRRLRKPCSYPDLEPAREAADSGDWSGYVRAMGGPLSVRGAMPIRLARKFISPDKTRYRDAFTKQIVGLELGTVIVPTRFHEWTLVRKVASESGSWREAPLDLCQ